MKREFALLLILALTAAVAAVPLAQSRPTPPPAPAVRAERPVPFKAGETLGYDISWSSYLTAGTATVTVREKRPSFDSVAWYIVAEGRPTPLVSKLYTLYYKADTLLDVYTLLPQRGSVYSEEGRRRRMKATRFDQAKRTAQYEVKTATVVQKDLTLPAYTQDALSIVYVLRALQLKPGAKITIPVADNGQVFRVQLTVVGRETVRVPYGEFPAWHVAPVILDPEGDPEGRKLAIWISDDARRLPLKMQADLAVGSFTIVLREARG